MVGKSGDTKGEKSWCSDSLNTRRVLCTFTKWVKTFSTDVSVFWTQLEKEMKEKFKFYNFGLAIAVKFEVAKYIQYIWREFFLLILELYIY